MLSTAAIVAVVLVVSQPSTELSAETVTSTTAGATAAKSSADLQLSSDLALAGGITALAGYAPTFLMGAGLIGYGVVTIATDKSAGFDGVIGLFAIMAGGVHLVPFAGAAIPAAVLLAQPDGGLRMVGMAYAVAALAQTVGLGMLVASIITRSQASAKAQEPRSALRLSWGLMPGTSRSPALLTVGGMF